MIERIKNVVSGAKFVALTITENGDGVLISATVRPKDGKDQTKPIQIKAAWEIADALLVEALNKPPKKTGKVEVVKQEEKNEEETDLFSGEDE